MTYGASKQFFNQCSAWPYLANGSEAQGQWGSPFEICGALDRHIGEVAILARHQLLENEDTSRDDVKSDAAVIKQTSDVAWLSSKYFSVDVPQPELLNF
jgi:hypothetical protein